MSKRFFGIGKDTVQIHGDLTESLMADAAAGHREVMDRTVLGDPTQVGVSSSTPADLWSEVSRLLEKRKASPLYDQRGLLYVEADWTEGKTFRVTSARVVIGPPAHTLLAMDCGMRILPKNATSEERDAALREFWPDMFKMPEWTPMPPMLAKR